MSDKTDYPYYLSSGTQPLYHTYDAPRNETYFVCENCKGRYLLPERGTELIRLFCHGCGGNLKEEK